MERLDPPELTPSPTTFEALLAPIASLLAEMAPAIDAQAQSRKLFFIPFVRLQIFAIVMRIPSLRQLVTELETSPTAASLNLPIMPFSTLKDGFIRFPVTAFERLFQHLVHTASWLEVEEIKALGPLCLVDGSLFRVLVRMSWAVYKKGKNALRLHLAFDLNHMIPVEFAIGAGTSSERAFLRSIVQAGLTYVADRGYFAFELFDHIQRTQAYFVMRAKENLQYTISESLSLTGAFPARWGNLSDQCVLLSNDPFQHSYRLVTFSVLGIPFLILTNRFDLTTFQVILIYAYRWQVELIFRFLKQGLQGTHLFSHSSQGSQVFFYLLLITALLQLQLKQGCAIQAAKETEKKTEGKTEKKTVPDPAETDPKADVPQAPHSFLAAIGAKLKTYWKIGCHWLRRLQNSLAKPFEPPVIRALGYD